MLHVFADPFWGKALGSAALGFVAWFGLDIFLFLTKRDFANLNVALVRFTRHDHQSASDKVQLRLLDFKIPLRTVLKNRYLFWYVVAKAVFSVSFEKPALNFRGHSWAILAPIRGEILKKTASAELKRWAGLPFKELNCRMVVVRDKSEDKKIDILTAMLIRDEDLENFQQYIEVGKKRPKKSRNLEFVKKIKLAWDDRSASFIDIDLTAA